MEFTEISGKTSCWTLVGSFSSFYDTYVHKKLCLVICIVGSGFNIINIIVFTRKNMVSPTNVVLTWLAVADLTQLLFYIPVIFGLPISYSDDWWWILEAVYLARLISIWMTLVLAVWRYLAIVHVLRARNWCNTKNTYRTVAVVYVLCSLIHILDHFNTTDIWLPFPTFIYILYTLWFCIIPSIALPILTLRQVFALWKAKKHRQKLMSSSVQQNERNSDRENQMNRTTRMLVVVIFLFLIPILPYEMIYVMNGEQQEYFGSLDFWICFLEFQDFFQMLLALDAATNFLVYYFMSSQFRKTYHILFNCNTFAAGKNFLQNKASNGSTAEETPVQLSSLETNFSKVPC